MAIVKINAIEVPAGAGPELERRFAARHGAELRLDTPAERWREAGDVVPVETPAGDVTLTVSTTFSDRCARCAGRPCFLFNLTVSA